LNFWVLDLLNVKGRNFRDDSCNRQNLVDTLNRYEMGVDLVLNAGSQPTLILLAVIKPRRAVTQSVAAGAPVLAARGE
jgi:hypothetical protein